MGVDTGKNPLKSPQSPRRLDDRLHSDAFFHLAWIGELNKFSLAKQTPHGGLLLSNKSYQANDPLAVFYRMCKVACQAGYIIPQKYSKGGSTKDTGRCTGGKDVTGAHGDGTGGKDVTGAHGDEDEDRDDDREAWEGGEGVAGLLEFKARELEERAMWVIGVEVARQMHVGIGAPRRGDTTPRF